MKELDKRDSEVKELRDLREQVKNLQEMQRNIAGLCHHGDEDKNQTNSEVSLKQLQNDKMKTFIFCKHYSV